MIQTPGVSAAVACTSGEGERCLLASRAEPRSGCGVDGHRLALHLRRTDAPAGAARVGLTIVPLIVALAVLRRRDWAGRYLTVTGLFPVALMLGYSFATGRSIYFTRYLTFTQVTWLVLIAFWAGGLRLSACAAILDILV